MRKRAEKESSGKTEANGLRKPKDILGNKVSVKVSKAIWSCSLPTASHPHSPCNILCGQGVTSGFCFCLFFPPCFAFIFNFFYFLVVVAILAGVCMQDYSTAFFSSPLASKTVSRASVCVCSYACVHACICAQRASSTLLSVVFFFL